MIPLIEVTGDYYDIGCQIGSSLKKQIKKTVKFPAKVAKEHQFFKIDYFVEAAQKYFSYANKYFPNLISEVKGIADGSGQDFDMIWLLNVEEILIDDYFDKCTSIVLREENDKIYLYHNEDFEDYYANNLAIIKANINNKVKFLSLTFAGMLCGSSISVNSFGLVQGINSLHPRDYRVGVPKNFISRAILECKNIKEALDVIKIKERASGYNHILVQGNNIIDVETTATKFKVFNVKDNIFVHTNNYLYNKFLDSEELESSKARLSVAKEIINKNKLVDKNVIMRLLSYHDKKSAICKHKNKGFGESTLSSLIADSTDLKIYATKGNPCKNRHEVYSLN